MANQEYKAGDIRILEGLDAVVIGRSNIVGKPISLMLQRHNATVTMCHTRTRDLAQHVARADLLVVGCVYLLGRFLPLLLVVGLRVALLPLLLFALRLRAILLTVHEDRFPYPAGKEKACSRFHVGNRLLVRHK